MSFKPLCIEIYMYYLFMRRRKKMKFFQFNFTEHLIKAISLFLLLVYSYISFIYISKYKATHGM